MTIRDLTEQQRKYAEARIAGHSRADAAAMAGYSASSAAALRAAAARLESVPAIAAAIEAGQRELAGDAAAWDDEGASEPAGLGLSEARLRALLEERDLAPYVVVQAASALARIEAEKAKRAAAQAPALVPLVVRLAPGLGNRAPTREEALAVVAQLGEEAWEWVREERDRVRHRLICIENRRPT